VAELADALDSKFRNERFPIVAIDRFQSRQLPRQNGVFSAILPINEG
jgi:hypothetical protein